MDKADAKKIVKILVDADGGCPTCVRELLYNFRISFPEFSEAQILRWATEGGMFDKESLKWEE